MKAIIAHLMLAIAPTVLVLPAATANIATGGVDAAAPAPATCVKKGECPSMSTRDVMTDLTGLFKRDCFVSCKITRDCSSIGCGTCVSKKDACGKQSTIEEYDGRSNFVFLIMRKYHLIIVQC
ncbi:hypothetical protein CONLIGDRAFT_650023 [Coniochaeta ligniaria NRRL 30616]|uniref:Uncharacterized protein n=1 Tax=Coniochaeta ligniaria NRRL 30616 TaxID=1408157 RepID=A0A1J7IZ64_9PEZI|nr:hypothetical protein CONLIGDRAFT_650023 [Coniochaeta ligniaria NRRL 30616]